MLGRFETVSTARTIDPSDSGQLLMQHQALIDESAIAPEVAAERGYRSVTTKAELERLGFAKAQRGIPALLLPILNVHGELVGHQARPDQPRAKDGKPVKYETVQGMRMAIDVPPRARPWIGDPKEPLYITEGVRKADAGVSKGLCVIALLGVWNWRGRNEHGGLTALPDWEMVALKSREVFIVFDSDVMTKPQVAGALKRLKAFLQSRGAHVRIVYLPSGPDGTKVGLDDFLATAGTGARLVELAQDELRDVQDTAYDGEYYTSDGSTYLMKNGPDGPVPKRLGNFTAQIGAELALDDGLEITHEFEITATVSQRQVTCSVPARSFASLNWVSDVLGARAIVSAGFGQKEHMRAAIQELSKDLVRRTVYTHTGWRQVTDVGWVYLHAAGAIGPKGAVPGIETRLPQALQGAVLPDLPEGEDLTRCIRAVLEYLALGPEHLMYSIVAAVFRAPLGDTDFSMFLLGVSDTFKTETAAIGQSFFGTGFTARNLPASWLSTANATETILFLAKDMMAVIDDYVPTGSKGEIQRMQQSAERVLRGQGNHAGRARLGADASFRQGRAPRGMALITGEEMPRRYSVQARVLVLEFRKGDIDVGRLTACQRLRDEAVFAKVMAAFLAWVTAKYEAVKKQVSVRARECRSEASANDRHRRTASLVGELQAGFELFLEFGQERAGLGAEEAGELQDRCWGALLRAAEDQEEHQASANPVNAFLRLLRSAVASGNAHLAGMDGSEPAEPNALGWRAGDDGRTRPLGPRVGWVGCDDLYLDPDASLKAAQAMASDIDQIELTTASLGKRLKEAGLLASTDSARSRVVVRRTIQGARAAVLHLHLGVLTGAAQSAHSAHGAPGYAEESGDGPDSWAGNEGAEVQTGPRNRPTDALGKTGAGVAGPVGPIGPLSGAHTAVGEDQGEWSA